MKPKDNEDFNLPDTYEIHLPIYFCRNLSIFRTAGRNFSWDAANVNDKLTLTINKRDFDAIYKKADSIVSPRPEETCGTDEELAAKFLYYKGVKFEMDNGVLNFRRIDFAKKKGMYVNYKGTKFNESYTLDNFIKLFLVASLSVQEKSGMKMIALKPEDTTSDFEWHFYFSKGRLNSIECWFPCD